MGHFLAIADYSGDELQNLLDLGIKLKKEWQSSGNEPILKNKTLAMIFQKPSLRTRMSFDMAMRHVAGDALYLSPNEIGLGKRESIADVARVVSGYVDIIMARVFDHEHVIQLAQWASVPVINGLSDYNHPCQALADALTIYEHYEKIKGLNVSYVGDGNNVAVSLMHICAKLGANFTIPGLPTGFELPDDTINQAQTIADESGSTLRFLVDPQEAVDNADVIYTDTWTSMGQEEETKKREAVFPPYQVDSQLVDAAKASVIVMHCLPAHRGHEITDEVADGSHSMLFPQAHNRLHAQKALLVRLLQVE